MSKPFHVYLDLDVLNNDTNPSSTPPQLSFEETRTQSFLDGTADDYFVAIARFTIQTGGAIPVFIPAILTGQSDVNKTVYSITLSSYGVDGTANIVYVPQPKSTQTLPAPPTTKQDLTGDYYYVYNYQDWINMVNTAFVTAQTQLVANLADYITQTLTLSTAGNITFTTSTQPVGSALLSGFDSTTVITLSYNNGRYLRLSNISTATVGGVLNYTYTVAIKDDAGNFYTSATITARNNRFYTSTLGTTVLTGSGGNTLTINNTSAPATLAAVSPPFLQFDTQSQTCTLNADLTTYSPVSGSASIYFNSRLFQLFAGFPYQFQGYGQDPKSYLIPMTSVGSTNTLTTTSAGGGKQQYLQAYQEITTVGLWNPVASIVFTSATLPIHPTLSSPPKVYSSDGMNGTGVTNLSNTLTDFEVPISATNSYRPEISYVPAGEYRLIDMYSNSNLNKIDLNVYWKDKYGNLKPLQLLPGCSASVKLLFRHKGFYLGAD